MCSYSFVANSLAEWIVDTGATRYIVQGKANFVEFYYHSVGSRTIVLGNDSGEDVFGVGKYQPRLHVGNKLLLHDALYAPKARCSLGFLFCQ